MPGHLCGDECWVNGYYPNLALERLRDRLAEPAQAENTVKAIVTNPHTVKKLETLTYNAVTSSQWQPMTMQT